MYRAKYERYSQFRQERVQNVVAQLRLAGHRYQKSAGAIHLSGLRSSCCGLAGKEHSVLQMPGCPTLSPADSAQLSHEYQCCSNDFERIALLRTRAAAGDIAACIWLRQAVCPWAAAVSAAAAGAGQLEVLQWLCNQQPPCPCDEWAAVAAAGNGQLEVLKYLKQAGCPFNSLCYTSAKAHPKIQLWLEVCTDCAQMASPF